MRWCGTSIETIRPSPCGAVAKSPAISLAFAHNPNQERAKTRRARRPPRRKRLNLNLFSSRRWNFLCGRLRGYHRVSCFLEKRFPLNGMWAQPTERPSRALKFLAHPCSSVARVHLFWYLPQSDIVTHSACMHNIKLLLEKTSKSLGILLHFWRTNRVFSVKMRVRFARLAMVLHWPLRRSYTLVPSIQTPVGIMV
jgi:hypothetical protein